MIEVRGGRPALSPGSNAPGGCNRIILVRSRLPHISDGAKSNAGYSARGHAIRPRGLVPMMASRSAGECADVRKK
ncbi:MAG: hypothetical protein EB140_01185 [Proteobacteria bacterium]|nr:hypothetical protein [Pseudomonadota bacterium]